MNRRSRLTTITGIYHIMNRGVSKGSIFFGGDDFQFFKHLLENLLSEYGFCLYAYCLMSDHYHLLVQIPRNNTNNIPKTDYEQLSTFMRRLDSIYARYYNKKYDRQGALFQDRYISVPVKNEKMLFTEILYIHNNPLKAGIVKKSSEYAYSSLPLYGKDKLVASTYIFSLINKADFLKMTAVSEARVLSGKDHRVDYDELHGRGIIMTDQEALDFVQNFLKMTIDKFRKLKGREMFKAFSKLKRHNIPLAQLGRISGIPIGRIRNLFSYWGRQVPTITC